MPIFRLFCVRFCVQVAASFGSTHTTIYFPEVGALQICLAPIDLQHEIIRRIEAAFKRVDRFFTGAVRADVILDRLDHAVLAKAFRGELARAVSNKS
jgi:type I restriction enzyme, S subunit